MALKNKTKTYEELIRYEELVNDFISFAKENSFILLKRVGIYETRYILLHNDKYTKQCNSNFYHQNEVSVLNLDNIKNLNLYQIKNEKIDIVEIDSEILKNIYNDHYNHLTRADKNIFQQFLLNESNSSKITRILNVLDDEIFFQHIGNLKNIKSAQKHSYEFNDIYNSLINREINTEEKIHDLIKFKKFYNHYFKKTENKTSLDNYLINKVSSGLMPKLVEQLGYNPKHQIDNIQLYEEEVQVKLLKINKEYYYHLINRIIGKKAPDSIYSGTLGVISDRLNVVDNKEKLKINSITLQPFTRDTEVAKIFIEHKSSSYDYPKLIEEIIYNVANNYEKSLTELNAIIDVTTDKFLLASKLKSENNITQKNNSKIKKV